MLGKYLLDDLKQNKFSVSKKSFNKINQLISNEEALYSGKFRNGSVGIAGTSNYIAPNFNKLNDIFDSELNIVLGGFNSK